MASAPRSVRAENVAGGKHWVERDYVARPVALPVGEVGEVGGRCIERARRMKTLSLVNEDQIEEEGEDEDARQDGSATS